MRLFLSVVLLFATVAAACAQARDTAFAVRKLFRQKRQGGEAMTSTAADIMASSTSQQDAASGVIAGAAPAVVGVLRGERYSARREAEILGLYAQGWPIPPDVRRKLRPKHFRRTKEDVLEEARRR